MPPKLVRRETNVLDGARMVSARLHGNAPDRPPPRNRNPIVPPPPRVQHRIELRSDSTRSDVTYSPPPTPPGPPQAEAIEVDSESGQDSEFSGSDSETWEPDADASQEAARICRQGQNMVVRDPDR